MIKRGAVRQKLHDAEEFPRKARETIRCLQRVFMWNGKSYTPLFSNPQEMMNQISRKISGIRATLKGSLSKAYL